MCVSERYGKLYSIIKRRTGDMKGDKEDNDKEDNDKEDNDKDDNDNDSEENRDSHESADAQSQSNGKTDRSGHECNRQVKRSPRGNR